MCIEQQFAHPFGKAKHEGAAKPLGCGASSATLLRCLCRHLLMKGVEQHFDRLHLT